MKFKCHSANSQFLRTDGTPIIFDNQGFYETDNQKDIEQLQAIVGMVGSTVLDPSTLVVSDAAIARPDAILEAAKNALALAAQNQNATDPKLAALLEKAKAQVGNTGAPALGATTTQDIAGATAASNTGAK